MFLAMSGANAASTLYKAQNGGYDTMYSTDTLTWHLYYSTDCRVAK